MKNFLFILLISMCLFSCGKVGPLSLPEDKLDKSVISYPCDEACKVRFEAEKERQQLVIIQAE